MSGMTVRAYIEEIKALHQPDPDGGMGYRDEGYGRFESACLVCGVSDEYAVEWPCRTYQLAEAAANAADTALADVS